MGRPALYEHQKLAVSHGLEYAYDILALDPGLGKSRCAIEIRDKLKLNCLVVAPGYLVPNWVKELKMWTDSNFTAFTSGKQIYEPCDTDFVIISYDLVQKAEHLFEWADMLVLDEAPNIKSMKANRTQFIHKNIYENSLSRVLLLTGTPLKNRVQEFYSLLAVTFYNPNAADSRFLDLYPSEIDFADHFSYREEYTMEINKKFVTITKWNGLKNTHELKEWLKDRYLRIKSEDVLDLPPITYKSVLISETPDHALLDAFNNHFLGEGSDSVNPTAKAEAALKKAPFTIKYAKDLLDNVDCVLIYTDHVLAAEEIAKAFNVKAITGKVPSVVRSQMADDFQAGQGQVLVATVGSMKEGKDLFRSNHIIFNDLPWVPGDIKQVIYRIQRIGQKSKCTIHRMLGSPQDSYIIEALDLKMQTIDRAT